MFLGGALTSTIHFFCPSVRPEFGTICPITLSSVQGRGEGERGGVEGGEGEEGRKKRG